MKEETVESVKEVAGKALCVMGVIGFTVGLFLGVGMTGWVTVWLILAGCR